MSEVLGQVASGSDFAGQLEMVEASFRRLVARPRVRMDEHRSTTPKKAGVYVIVEQDRAIYVGRDARSPTTLE